MEDWMIHAAAGAAGGLVAGFLIATFLFQGKFKRLKAAAPSNAAVAKGAPRGAGGPQEAQFFRKMGKAHEMIGHQKSIEVIDSNVTRSDVERASRVGLEYHLSDLISELKENKRLNHLIRIVINGYKDPLWEHDELREYFHSFDADHPEAVFFIEEKSLTVYLRILREARIAHFEAPLDIETDLDSMKKHLLQDKGSIMEKYQAEADLFISNLMESEDRDVVIAICDEVLERISTACDAMP